MQTFKLNRDTMKIAIFTKSKQAARMTASLLLACLAMVASGQGASDDLTAQQIMANTRAAYAALTSYRDSGSADYQMSAQHLTLTFNTRLQRPNRYRIDWTQKAGLKGAVWSQGDGDYLQVDPGSPASPAAMAELTAAKLNNDTSPRKMKDMEAALRLGAALSFTAASLAPAVFFNQQFGDFYTYPAISGKYPVRQEKDDAVGKIACYVISTEQDLSKAGKPGSVSVTLWIGKQDFLVHQSRTRYVETVDDNAGLSDQALDDAIKKSLEMQHKPVTPEAIAAMRPQMRAMMKQVQSTLKAGYKEGVVTTVTHENINANPSFAAGDFAR
jgi:hypothetical protein